MEDLEQAPPKFKDTQPKIHDPTEEVNLDIVKESRITYISPLLPSDFKKRDYCNTTGIQRLLCLELQQDARIG